MSDVVPSSPDEVPADATLAMTVHYFNRVKGTCLFGVLECEELRIGDEVLVLVAGKLHRGIVRAMLIGHEAGVVAARGRDIGVNVWNWGEVPLVQGIPLYRRPGPIDDGSLDAARHTAYADSYRSFGIDPLPIPFGRLIHRLRYWLRCRRLRVGSVCVRRETRDIRAEFLVADLSRLSEGLIGVRGRRYSITREGSSPPPFPDRVEYIEVLAI